MDGSLSTYGREWSPLLRSISPADDAILVGLFCGGHAGIGVLLIGVRGACVMCILLSVICGGLGWFGDVLRSSGAFDCELLVVVCLSLVN